MSRRKETPDEEIELVQLDEAFGLVVQADASVVTEINIEADVEGTELESFESVSIEDILFVEQERVESIVESVLFASDRPVSLSSLKVAFKGTNVKTDHIRRAIEQLSVEYAGAKRGVCLEEVTGGYQLRTKIDNMDFIRRNIKARSFRLSGPAMEVLSIVAYKQPIIKSEIDVIRGVESGHLLRALMERGIVNFEGKSELPGRPMQYGTTRKFLEIFGLRNLKELPTLSQIDELLPDGIGEEDEVEKQKLSDLTSQLSQEVIVDSYSQGEDELTKIQEQLEVITTSSRFFEEEKERQRQKRDFEKAQNIREALALGETVGNRDLNWLKKYDEILAAGKTVTLQEEKFVEETSVEVESLFESETHEELPNLATDEELEGP
ncbi:MAG: SMC-Scp complex subunit ScpB [Bdellovibrionota bacterium]